MPILVEVHSTALTHRTATAQAAFIVPVACCVVLCCARGLLSLGVRMCVESDLHRTAANRRPFPIVLRLDGVHPGCFLLYDTMWSTISAVVLISTWVAGGCIHVFMLTICCSATIGWQPVYAVVEGTAAVIQTICSVAHGADLPCKVDWGSVSSSLKLG